MNRFATAVLGFLIAVFFWPGSSVLAQESTVQATVVQASRHNTSVPLTQVRLPASAKAGLAPFAIPNKGFRYDVKGNNTADKTGFTDPVLQVQAGTLAPTVFTNFEGLSDDDNAAVIGFRVVPPDTDGDVGPNHYLQWINSITEIFDKNGNTLLGPVAGNIYFQGLGGDCEADNDGDPIVLYDESADRWLVSQFSVSASPYSMCVAISATADPLGSYHQYEFNFGTDFPDYPKLGIWGDSYTMTTRDFANGAFFAGISAVALDRTAMLNGQPATMVRFPNAFGGTSIDGYLPADADGAISGPPLFGGHGDDNNTTFELWELDVNWGNPNQASFTSIPGVGVSAFDGIVPSVNQPNGQVLDDHSFFTMHRLHVRDFGSHVSMVANHTVETQPNTAGIRWYEFRNTGGNWSNYQEGTYSPDSDDRWMGSIAINASGDIALGYSRSSSALFPSIYVTGQTADQSGSGIMNVEETLIHAGTGSQSGNSRWGDYSMMSVDPVDDRFWYTTEYYAETASFDFKTRIAAFQLGDGGGGNIPPVASFTSSCTLLSCDFTDASSDGDGSVVNWSWDFGDGASSTAQNPSHTYAANGVYTVTLTVTDDAGATDDVAQNVTVNDGTSTGTMHVMAITSVVNRANSTVDGTVVIVDENGVPVAGASVTGTFSGEVSGTDTADTDVAGEALLRSDPVTGRRPRDIQVCVDTVTHPTLTYDPAANADPTFACDSTPPPPGDAMHIASITTSVVRGADRTATGEAVVTIVDNNGALVATATVSGTFSGDVTGTDSGVTGGTGMVTLVSDVSSTRPRVVNFCVDTLTHPTLAYDPAGNGDPSYDCLTAAPSAAAPGMDRLTFSETPVEFALSQNYPNPFNPTTIISYALPEAAVVTVRVFNMLGQEITTLVDGYQSAGRYDVAFNAQNLSAGIYLYTIEAGDFSSTRRMTLLK